MSTFKKENINICYNFKVSRRNVKIFECLDSGDMWNDEALERFPNGFLACWCSLLRLLLECCSTSLSEKLFSNLLYWFLSRKTELPSALIIPVSWVKCLSPFLGSPHFSHLMVSEELPGTPIRICFLYLPLCHCKNSVAFLFIYIGGKIKTDHWN